MEKALRYIDHINEHTAWRMRSDVVHKMNHVRNSYIECKDGVRLEKGFLSEIIALKCKNNPDVNKGKHALDILIDEAGTFGTPGLLKSTYNASQDCVMEGAIKKGLITIFGVSSGDMEGGTADFADMFSRPLEFDLLPFENIWDVDSENQKVGFFHPINWNMEGFYDKQGNSDKEKAKSYELNERKKLKYFGATEIEIQGRSQERPLSPSEAFSNEYPTH